MHLDAYILPALLGGITLCAFRKNADLYGALVRGAAEGVNVLLRIFPVLVGLLTAIAMLRASGTMEFLSRLLTPLLRRWGIPPETVPLMLIRPVSGSGALAVVTDLIQTHGADSLVGRTAAVMMGSTETTFYTTAVYFGAAGIRDTRHTIPAALAADVTGFFVAALTTRLLFGM